MKSRNLHSITRNGLLGIIALSTFAMTSCSRSLTSMQNTKKMGNEQVLGTHQQNSEKQIVALPQIDNPTPAPIAKPNSELVSPVKQSATAAIDHPKKHSLFASHSRAIKNQILDKVQTGFAAIQPIVKNNSIASAKNVTKTTEGGMIRRAIICFIIALIFYLVGFLFFWPLSEVFYIIATIFLVVGIIYLLFGLLREM